MAEKDSNSLTRSATRRIPGSAWLEIVRFVEGLPSGLASSDGVRGFDGTHWVIEIVEAGRYRVIDRWTPEFETDERRLREFAKLGDFLLKISEAGK
jgi:hypothetical protein